MVTIQPEPYDFGSYFDALLGMFGRGRAAIGTPPEGYYYDPVSGQYLPTIQSQQRGYLILGVIVVLAVWLWRR